MVTQACAGRSHRGAVRDNGWHDDAQHIPAVTA